MMVSCPGCNNKYLVDDRKIPAGGGALTCRECGKKWKISLPVDLQAESAAMAAGESIPKLSESSSGIQKPVSCPKCGHFFVPYVPRSSGTKGSGSRREDRPRGKVLLVEDQKYFAELTCEALGEDFETTVTANLGAARSLIAAGGFDLVILDLSLEEGQDGTQILAATRSLGIPVLIFTARDETELYGGAWDQLKAAGATDILIKGVNVGDELRQKVKSLLSTVRK